LLLIIFFVFKIRPLLWCWRTNSFEQLLGPGAVAAAHHRSSSSRLSSSFQHSSGTHTDLFLIMEYMVITVKGACKKIAHENLQARLFILVF
jgi:hypothetical protein